MNLLRQKLKNNKITLLLLSLLVVFVFPKNIFAKDYSIESVDFEVRLNKDGSANIIERRTYNFVGSFSWADEWIDTGSYKLTDIKLTGADNFTTEITDSKVYIKWDYTALDEQKTFTLTYDIVNAITIHSDISEFYWKLIGSDWDKETKVIKTKVFLPVNAPDDQIWAFGHGPLNGKVSIVSNHEINFEANDLPANKFFEVRVLFPKANFINARVGNSNLQSILDEEKQFGTATKTKGYGFLVAYLLLTLFFLFRLVVWIIRFIKEGKDKKLPEINLAGSLHEPPSDLEPSHVELLISSTNTGKSIVATILNLVRKKNLKIEFIKGGRKSLFGNKDQYFLIYNNSKNLSKMETLLVNFLFGGKSEKLDFEDIKKFNKTRPTKTYEFWQEWRTKAREDLKKMGFYEQKSLDYQKKIGIETIILGIISFFAPFLFLIVFIMILLTILMPKKSDWGGKEMAGWLAFKKWLYDYSVTKNYPIDSVILWEKYLVYGTVLGISIKALSQLPIKFSEAFSSSGIYVMGHMGSDNSFANFESSFSSITESLKSASSGFSNFGASGVGSSGGFSGGGGGGAG